MTERVGRSRASIRRTQLQTSCRKEAGGGSSNGSFLIDPKFRKLEGTVRTYEDESPTITGRDYKEPLMVGVEVTDGDTD